MWLKFDFFPKPSDPPLNWSYRVSHDTGHLKIWLSPRLFLNMNCYFVLNFSLSAQKQHILVFRKPQTAVQCTVE